MEVLAVDPEVQRATPAGDASAVFARVRVIDGGQTGWAFVRFTELSDACPLRAEESPPESTTSRIASLCTSGVEEFVRRGVFRSRNGPILCGWGQYDQVQERLDVNGDGTADEVLSLNRYLPCERARRPTGDYEGAHAVRWRTPGGWSAAVITERISPDRPWRVGAWYEGTVRAGRAVYFRVRSTAGRRDRNCVGLPVRVEHDEVQRSLSRLHPCGAVVPVFRAPPFLGDGCTFRGLDDESVQVECGSPARALTLRWDAATFRLIPDGAAFAVFHGTHLCDEE